MKPATNTRCEIWDTLINWSDMKWKKSVAFTLAGNEDDQDGNPRPKLKMTGRQHWTPKAKQYVAWKGYVVNEFLRQVPEDHREMYLRNYAEKGKPIIVPKGLKAFMALNIEWKNNHHADPENVFGSIADALFVDDNNLSGFFDAYPTPTGKGVVTIAISLPE